MLEPLGEIISSRKGEKYNRNNRGWILYLKEIKINGT